MPTGKIGGVEISRLICGGNLINGYAHSRDLIYVSPLLRHYFTDEKILETWALCEAHGVNTMILYPADRRTVSLYERYRAQGGRIQYLAQVNPDKGDLLTPVKQARDAGAVGRSIFKLPRMSPLRRRWSKPPGIERGTGLRDGGKSRVSPASAGETRGWLPISISWAPPGARRTETRQVLANASAVRPGGRCRRG